MVLLSASAPAYEPWVSGLQSAALSATAHAVPQRSLNCHKKSDTLSDKLAGSDSGLRLETCSYRRSGSLFVGPAGWYQGGCAAGASTTGNNEITVSSGRPMTQLSGELQTTRTLSGSYGIASTHTQCFLDRLADVAVCAHITCVPVQVQTFGIGPGFSAAATPPANYDSTPTLTGFTVYSVCTQVDIKN
jgi:hypothetical protein